MRRQWKLRLRDHWWLACVGYGTTLHCMFWYLLAEARRIEQFSDGEYYSMLLTSALCCSTLSCLLLRAAPTDVKRVTLRQARFNPGNDRT